MTTPNDVTDARPTDPRPIIDRAIVTAAEVFAAVRPDQLGAPTPCPGMDVRTMLTHVVGVVERIGALGRGEDPFGVVEIAAPDDGWTDALAAASVRAVDAWRDDDVLDRPMALPWIQGSGADILTSYLSEITVHTWDIAVATAQRPRWDDVVVTAALDARPILPASNRRALFEEISAAIGLPEVAIPFAEAVSVPDDAPAIDRLVAWNGRDPSADRP